MLTTHLISVSLLMVFRLAILKLRNLISATMLLTLIKITMMIIMMMTMMMMMMIIIMMMMMINS